MKRGMNKFFSIVLVLCMLISMIPMAVFAATPATLYLKPNSNWLSDGARFAAYFFGNGESWASMTDSDGDGVYECAVPSGFNSVIFCRMNPGSSTNDWSNKWNQTSDLTIPSNGNNCYTVADGTWDAGGGSWSTISTETVAVDYYLFGYINGANYGCEEDAANLGSYKFSSGKLTATFTQESYVGVKTGDNANWYMTEGFQGTSKSATLYNTASGIVNPDKLYIPAGIKVTFTLTENSDGTLTLTYSTTASSCQHLFYTSGVCNACGSSCSHSWSGSSCTKCGTVCSHTWSDGSCSVCGTVCNHSYSNGKCSICGKAEPSCSHSFTSKVTTAATCTTAGVKTFTCSKCGEQYTESIAATGHSYSGGSCTSCGAADPSYNVNYYLVGFINGANYGCEEDYENMGSYKFSSGTLTATFTADSYVFVKTEGNGAWYLAESYCTDTTCKLVQGGSEKLYVPGGVKVTFTLTQNTDGSLTIKYTTSTSSCSHLNHTPEGKCSLCGASVSHTWSSGYCSCGLQCVHASHSQSGICSTCGVSVSHSYSGNTCTVCGKTTSSSTVKIHFVDAVVWQNVTAHVWKVNGSTTTALNTWPGEILNRDANGYFTLELDYKPVSGESLGFIFTNFNGGQTADTIVSYSTLSSGEVWIKPNNWTNGDGKYDCYVTTVESSMYLSPEIHGTSVTFRYENSSASSVYLAGSMNSWSTSANKLTKGSDGIWTTTMTLSEGVYEYKFVVDGEWILDPKNGLIGGYDGNSLVVIGSAGSTTASNITVKLHFYRESGDYTDWDAWMWSSTNEGQGCTFVDDSVYKGKTATFTIPGGTNAWVNYKIRKTDWSDEEFYTRSIDISNIASGTVHFFLNSGSATGSTVYGNDVIKTGKPTYANLDYNSGNIWVKTPLPVSGDFTKAFSVLKSDGSASGISVTGVTMDNNGYSLTLSRKPALIEVHDLVVKCGTTVGIETDGLFYSSGFAADYTYYGNDLGATWSKNSTTFKVWAPTATGVSVMLFKGGNHGGDDWISTTPMTLGEKGVYSVTISGDLDGTYYNFLVSFPGYTTEATDPYAKTTGANGDRGMIINMDAYDPEGWDRDLSPNQGMNYTDAIIYEMHIREMTIDSTSGVQEAWRGKYLGLTQEGTKYEGRATALDHIKELGVTHVQLMPTYDHAGVDEYHLTDWQQYAWGYNPKNFNVPEGSFATDPYNGEVRVTEMKQMVQAFHSKGINVVMDVVYNHTYDGGNFCYNKIVPNYFSRFWGENNWSNGSGVGNDFATERSMGRNYIVDSIFYWVEEYHIDGFRFDLAGLIDIQTINEVISTVQARYPYVIFYGEGWAVGGTAIQDGHWTATKENAWQTGSMAFYNDTFRNDIAGDNGNSWGFATGDSGKADKMGDYFRASNGWSNSPSQTINYVSCHDNYTLIDKIIISRNGAYWDQMVKMNNMSAAIYMLAQGIPYMYSGEELLREKKDEWGNRYHNTYDSSDYVTKIRWNDLVDKDYAQVTDDYYAGLINFRKNHAALRCTNGSDAWGYTSFHKINDHCVLFYVSGYPNYECSDGIVIIYNANEGTQWLNIYDYGVPYGNWQACIHGMTAGVNPLWSTYDGSVGVEGLSTTVLVLGDLVHEESVYNNQSYSCSHGYHNQSGLCWDCGAKVDHYFVNGYCNHCNLSQEATGTMTLYYDNSTSQWGNVYAYAWTETGGRTTTYTEGWPGTQMTSVGNNIFAVTVPCAANNVIFTDNYGNQTVTQGIIKNDNGVLTSNLYYSSSASWGNYTAACSHTSHNSSGVCSNCGVNVGHNWSNGYCSGCNTTCSHSSHNVSGVCTNCGASVGHSWVSGSCTGCSKTCTHSWSDGKCSTCGMSCSHSGHDQNGTCYTCGYAVGHSYSGGLCSVCSAYKQGYIESQSYYLVGYINGANYGCEDDYQNLGSYKFSGGSLTATFSSDSYVFVKTGDNASYYMTDGYQDGVTSVTLYDSRTVSGDKLFVPGGKEVTFTLSVNSSNNTMMLNYTVEDPVCSHSYASKVTTAATCETAGVKTFTCTKCGDSYTQSIAAIGHNYTPEVTTAATCTMQGVETYTCTNCADSYTQIIPVIAHSYSDGLCTSCGAPDPDYAVTDTGFVLVTNAAQITSGGKFVIVANNNGTYQAMDTTLSSGKFAPVTVTVDGRLITGTDLPVWTVEAVDGGIALSLDGSYLSYSSSTNFKLDTASYAWSVTAGDSGFILNSVATTRGIYYQLSSAKFGAYSTTYQSSSSYISNLQLYKYQVGTQGCTHSYTSTVTTAATCTAAGVNTFTCTLCGNSYTEAIPATGHSFSDGSCTVCGTADPSVPVDYTYYLVGYINGADYGCEGDYENNGIYKFVDGKLTATFETDSYVFIKTEGNGKWLLAESYCEATTCTFVEGGSEKMFVPGNAKITFTLTENADGSVTVSYTAESTACSHSYTSTVTTAATCTASGIKTYTCSKCGDSYTETIAATGHNYSSGSCTVCGAYDPDYSVTDTGYVRVFDASDLASGKYVIVANNGTDDLAMDTTLASGKFAGTAVTVDGALITGSDLPVWTLEVVDGGVTLSLDGQYLAYNSSTNFKLSADPYVWTAENGDTGIILHSSATTRGIYLQISSGKFGAYATSNVDSASYVSNLQLYKYQVGTQGCTHSYTSTVTTAATCTAAGVKTFTCTLCGNSYTEAIPATGHSFSDGSCTVCGTADPSVPVDYTYYLVGYINGADYGCEGDYENNGIYKFVDGKLTATFEMDSYVFIKTEGNGKWLLAESYCEATTCTFVEGGSEKMFVPGNAKITFTLTENADGSVTVSYTAESTACSHSYTSSVTTAATCTVNGVKTYTCSKCGDSYTEAIAATGHNYASGSCTVCGAYDPGYSVTDTGYVLVTDISQITMGGKFLLVANNNGTYQAMDTTLASGKFAPVTVTVDGRLITGTDLPVWTVEAVDGGIALSLDGSYLSYNSSTNFKMDTAAYTWTVTASDSGYILNSAATSRGIYYSISAAKFGAYSTSYQTSSSYISSLQLYKYQVGSQGCAHSYTSKVTTAPTCTANGVMTYTCSLCDYSFTESIAATGHSFSGGSCTICGAADPSVSVDYTYYLVGYINGADYGCEADYENMGIYKFEDGELTTTFESDSYIFVKTEGNGKWLLAESYTEATTCTFKEGGTEKMFVPGGVQLNFVLTENTDGSVTVSYTTTSCEHSYTSKVTTAATCTTAGVKTFTCSKCGHSYTQSISATGHSYASSVTTAATCTANGVKTYTCSACSDQYTEVIAAAGHNYISGTCSVCGTADPNCTHSYTSKVTVAATCTQTGLKTFTCTKCGDVYNETIAATGHSFSDGKCTSCGIADPSVSANTYYLVGYINGADYGCEADYENMGIYKFANGKLTATFTQESYIFVKTEGNGKWLLAEAYCTDATCTFVEGGTEKMYVPGGVALTFTLTENSDGSVTVSYTQGGSAECSHSYTSSVTTAATCTAAGVMTYTCSKCSASYTQSIPATGHNFSDGQCTSCGMADPSVVGNTYYLVGYINGADYGCEADYENMGIYKFVDGKLTATFTQDSYIFVKTEGNGKWLLSDAYCEATTCTFREGATEKMFVPGNVSVTFTLTENADGSVTVSYTTAGSGSASTVPTLTLKAPTLEFKDTINVAAFYTAENIGDVVEMGMITYSTKVSSWSVDNAEYVIPGYTYDATTGRYLSKSQGIFAKNLGDTVYLAVYAKLSDGTYAYSKLASYSPVQYATSQLKNPTDTALKQLVVAMLNYGAEAQLFFGHNTGALANASLTAEQLALPAAYSASMVSSVPAASATKQGIFANNSGFAKRYPAISFEGAFCINYFFTPNYAPASGITLYYWNAEDYAANSVLSTSNATGKFKMTGSGTGEYRGDITGIAAKAISDAVYVAAAYKDADGTVWTSGVLGYSIGAYCASQASKDVEVTALAKATAVYGYHAKAYFG